MYIDTEGVILKQVKTVNGRKIVLLFSNKYGKISAGTSISEKGRSKAALAMHPFTHGRYELYKNRDSFNINGAEVIKSYYKIGEDVDKYMACSYILEFTEKLAHENLRSPELFQLLLDFLEIMEKRQKKYTTMVLAYQVKALQIMGTMPELNQCVECGSEEILMSFSIKGGGVICEKCRNLMVLEDNEKLIYDLNFDIVNVLRYFSENPLKNLENLALDDVLMLTLQNVLKKYVSHHLDIKNLKSEGFLIEY
jgi:DNA repair protein RecO (recombination protein O)